MKEIKTLIICLALIIIFGIIAYAYINSPTTITIEMITDNNTVEMFKSINYTAIGG